MTENETQEYQVNIPEESFALLEFGQENQAGSAVVNVALRDFEPKIVFGWHLSLIVELDDVDEDNMPTDAERDVIDEFGKRLDIAIIGNDSEKPNAVFLAQVLFNGTLELIWRVYEPERVNEFLQSLYKESGDQKPREFDFQMEYDPEWKICQWHLKEHPEAEAS